MEKNKYIILFILLFNFQFAEYGKNIVQYDNFEWHFIQTMHFDIYYYSHQESQIDFVASYAEKAYDKISNLIGWDLNNRSSIIVYNSHIDFQQTNVVNSYMREGIGGVTELMKNRMVIPFDGSHKDFKHVIYHELVHVFINDGIYGGSLKNLINSNTVYIPLWMNEGIAEYLASKWDANSDMWIRDLALNYDQIPEIKSLNGYLAYRGGQSVWNFIAEKWGEESIKEIFYNVQLKNNINKGFKESIGVDIDELSQQWHKYIKKEYWPDITIRDDIQDISRQITNHEELYNSYNISPSPSPDGSEIAMYSNIDGEMGIYIISSIDGKFLRKIIKGNKTAEHEELHILKPGISWSPDGDKIVFAAKSKGEDALFIYHIREGNKQEKISFNNNEQYNIKGISRPAWNPILNEIAFIGHDGFSSDVYIYNIDNDTLKNITNDWFSDTQVSWHPNGKDLLIVSDRDDNQLGKKADILNFIDHDVESSDIYKLIYKSNLTYEIIRMTNTPFNESHPIYSPNSNKIAYLSDNSGINNIYITDDEYLTSYPITNVLTGITQINWNSNDQLIFTGFYKSGFDIFAFSNINKFLNTSIDIPVSNWKNKKEIDLLINSQLSSKSSKNYEKFIFDESNIKKFANNIIIDESVLKNEQGHYYPNKYNTRFTLDYAQASYTFDSYYGNKAMGTFLFSDILGDHRVGFGIELGDITQLKDTDYFLTYDNLKNRANHQWVLYHQAYKSYWIETNFGSDGIMDPGDTYEQILNRNLGLYYTTSFPFSRFSRFETSINFNRYIRQTIETNYWGSESTIGYNAESLFSPYIKYVWDNTRWFFIYPVSGSRIYIKYDFAPSASYNDYNYKMLTFDSRSYVELSFKNKVSFAARVFAGTSWGDSERQFLIGGAPWIFSSDNNMINSDYEQHMDDSGGFYFMNNYLIPIRGYELATKYGQNAILMNYELRLPFFMYYVPTIEFLGQIFGVFFVDVGVAWNDEFPKYSDESSWINPSQPLSTICNEDDCSGWLMSYGFGPRFIMFGMPWKLDYAWQYNPHKGKISNRKWYISIGFDF